MLNLRKREVPSVFFRGDLPDFLADGEKCFIEIDARAAGPVNIEYTEGMEQIGLQAAVMDRTTAKITDDKEFVEKNSANVKSIIRSRLGVLFDTCVIEWRSNILDGDAPIECDREHFMALCDVKVPEIAEAITKLEIACLEAGGAIQEQDENTIKN